MVTNDLMEARYGRKRRANRDRKMVIGLGSALLVALVAFIVWATFGTQATVTGTVSTFNASNNHLAVVAIAVDNKTGKSVRCQVSATNANQSSVGSKEVNLAADQTSVQDINIITTQPAEGAVVDSCWNR
ncbi:MAG: hypothetical protein RJA35_1048 [Actinomycetota bacterium]|jgi:type II secretory pathway component PulM